MSLVFNNSAYLLSGVSAYACMTHMQVGLRRPMAIKHILFALICLCISISSPFNALINSAQSIPEYIFASKVGYTFVILFIILLSWFIPVCTDKKPVYFIVATNLLFASMLILNLIRPYGFQFDLISDLQQIPLPWGEHYVVAVGKISLIYKITVLVFLLLMAYLVYSLIRLAQNYPTKNNIAMLLATFFLIATYIEAILVRTGVINFLPLGTFGGLGLIIVMSMVLNKDHDDERNAASSAIAKQNNKLETILRTANDGIYILDKNGLLVQANDAFLGMLKLDQSAINKLKLHDWNQSLESADLRQAIQAVLNSDEKVVIETRQRRRDGVILDVEISMNALELDGYRYLLCAARDITERKLLLRELEQKAHTDYLTQVNNRGHFMLLAEQTLAASLRYNRKISLFMLDIDHFKKINDSHGHKGGDLVLQKLIEICQTSLREADIIGRIGGEEFAILLPETDDTFAFDIADRLRANIANTQVEVSSGLFIHFTVSIGISALDDHHATIDSILSAADKALYRAKNSGRNKVVLYSE